MFCRSIKGKCELKKNIHMKRSCVLLIGNLFIFLKILPSNLLTETVDSRKNPWEDLPWKFIIEFKFDIEAPWAIVG